MTIDDDDWYQLSIVITRQPSSCSRFKQGFKAGWNIETSFSWKCGKTWNDFWKCKEIPKNNSRIVKSWLAWIVLMCFFIFPYLITIFPHFQPKILRFMYLPWCGNFLSGKDDWLIKVEKNLELREITKTYEIWWQKIKNDSNICRNRKWVWNKSWWRE